MKNRLEERAIHLTEEEAMGLLELGMTCPMDLSFEQRAALVKLSEFCRQFMRSESCKANTSVVRDEKNVTAAYAA